MSQSLCVISTKTPYQGQFAREALDAVFVAASYDIPSSLLLMGDGVYQLMKGQSPDTLPGKNLSTLLSALPLYNIETVYIDEQSLKERNIHSGHLQSPFTLLEPQALAGFLNKHSQVLNF